MRHAVIAAARELERRMPDKVTTNWWKEERGERVFVDFNQANRDRTIAGAYSPRALPHAPVSCPITWDELGNADPKDFTILTVPDTAENRGGPLGGHEREPGHHRHAARMVGARRQERAGGTAVPAGLPEDAGRTAARAAQPGEEAGVGGLTEQIAQKSAPTDARPDGASLHDGLLRGACFGELPGGGLSAAAGI